ncbi:MAG: hypothetical protein HN509_11750 [Halobacteriovoraceae bacterium]|jgi:hypothetical protein|nr:hypothetical protein [Halobacteriovoraceae bacterium]MBT5095093.1 hypothetical protein [Halobacteriovoraceae bacterium]
MKTALFAAFILLSTSAYAQSNYWSGETRSFLKKVQFPYPDRFASSLKSICRLNPPKWQKMSNKIIDATVPHPKYLKKGMWIKYAFKKRPSPLMIILPGAFTTMNGDQSRYLADAFLKRDYHILVLTNPWGVSYINNGPLNTTGDLLAEGRSLHDFLVDWKKSLSPETKNKITSTSLFGISYGAFASAMIGAYDAALEDPVIDGMITAISPPINMAKTMVNLDDSIISIAARIRKGKLSFLGAYRRLCKSKNQSEISEKDLATIKVATVKMGFHQSMIKNIVAYSDFFKLDWYPARTTFNRAYNNWQYQTLFQSYFEEYAPLVGDVTRSQYGTIQYWIDQARLHGKNNIRVLAAKDDFLNSITGSDQEYSEFKDPAFVTIPHGGHFGFAARPWFEKFLDLL